MGAKRSYAYRVGLARGWAHARRAADAMDVAPTVEGAAKENAPSDLDPAEYRAGYRDGIVRHAAGKRSPSTTPRR